MSEPSAPEPSARGPEQIFVPSENAAHYGNWLPEGRVEVYIRADRARLVLAEESGWREIGTAPTNTAILVNVSGDDYYRNGGSYAAILVDMGSGRRWFSFGRHVGRDMSDAPTHWMPLPAPPGLRREGE